MIIIYYLEKDGIPFYIGKTGRKLSKREYEHKNIFGNNLKLIELDQCENKKEIWKFWEGFYIELFKSWGFILLNKNKGGGGAPCGFYNREGKHVLAYNLDGTLYKEFISINEASRETKCNISSILFCLNNIAGRRVKNFIWKYKLEKEIKNIEPYKKYRIKGIKCKIETKNKISYSNKGKFRNELQKQKMSLSSPFKKPILQYDLKGNFIKEWPSIKEASISNKTRRELIGKCCSNKIEKAGNYKWKFK